MFICLRKIQKVLKSQNKENHSSPTSFFFCLHRQKYHLSSSWSPASYIINKRLAGGLFMNCFLGGPRGLMIALELGIIFFFAEYLLQRKKKGILSYFLL